VDVWGCVGLSGRGGAGGVRGWGWGMGGSKNS